MWFKNLRIFAKLTSAFFLCAVITLVIGLMGMNGNGRLGDMVESLFSNNLASVTETDRVLYNTLYFDHDLYQLLTRKVSGAPSDELDNLVQDIALRKELIDKSFAVYRQTPLRDDERAFGDKFTTDWRDYQDSAASFVHAVRDNPDPSAARALLRTELSTLFRSVEKDMQGIIASNLEQADGANKDAYDLTHSLKMSMIIGIVVAFLLAIGLGLIITRLITTPIASAVQAAQQVASGDLTQRIQPTSADETGQLLVALGAMQTNLRTTIQNISSASEQLASAAEELNVVTDDSTRGLLTQNDEIQQAATAVNEMTAAVDEVARNAVSTSEVSQQTNTNALAGRSKVQEAVRAIETMVSEIDASTIMVQGLAAQTKDISKVLDVIRAVAEQTNLLALNAAIEAARAGEQGRGFAVVADEVRALAHRTQTSTGEIESMISAAQTSANKVVLAMANSQTLANSTHDLAQAAGVALDSITAGISQISERNLVIASASEEQAQVAREVDRNLINIQGLSAQTTTGAHQTSASSHELSRLALSFNELVAKFRL
jgi:methyl-accepting chemotaxis protein